jgi:hypothetical protein
MAYQTGHEMSGHVLELTYLVVDEEDDARVGLVFAEVLPRHSPEPLNFAALGISFQLGVIGKVCLLRSVMSYSVDDA